MCYFDLFLRCRWRRRGGKKGGKSKDGKFEGIVAVLYEYLDLCVDWGRFVLGESGEAADKETKEVEGKDDKEAEIAKKREALKGAVRVLVAAAVRSGASKEVRDQVDKDRAGIAIWRIP